MAFVGMDHGTTGVSFSILDDDITHFKIGREETSAGTVSAVKELSKRINFSEIELMAITYAMGDGISAIMPLESVKNRGILSMEGAGKVTGGGTAVYDEISNSGIPTVLIPGIHRNTPSLYPWFKAAYSHHASSEKISIAYHAYLKTDLENLIISDISSNTVSILVENGKIMGAMDACLGAMGVVHGPLDLKMIRDIDDGLRTANECFSHAGAVKVADVHEKVAHAKDELVQRCLKGDEKSKLALETMIMTIAMEIHGLAGITEQVDAVVLTGSIGSMMEPLDVYGSIKEKIKDIADVVRVGERSGSIGSAQIARAVYNGAKEILGIPVNF
ncbi:MAG TPA: methanogenesis marker 12 protein [Methanobacterium sp.]|nr:methanogenesis marker 12 protein [Methanobacterium sp.]